MRRLGYDGKTGIGVAVDALIFVGVVAAVLASTSPNNNNTTPAQLPTYTHTHKFPLHTCTVVYAFWGWLLQSKHFISSLTTKCMHDFFENLLHWTRNCGKDDLFCVVFD